MNTVLYWGSACVGLTWVVISVLCAWRRAWPGATQLPGASSSPTRQELPDSETLVVVPARDEAEALGETLGSLLTQGEAASLVVLADDRSTDDTPRAAIAAAKLAGEEERLHVVLCPEPQPGWMGKMSALATGLAAGKERLQERKGRLPRWVLFTDADIRHPPDSIERLRVQAETFGLDLVSVMVRLRAKTFWERLLIPPFVWFFQLLYPFHAVQNPRSRVAAAAGGCVLVRRELLEHCGGIEAIRGEVIDDVSLARRLKRAGGKLWLGLDPEMVSVRGYDTLGEITRMVARSAFHQLRYNYALLAGTVVALLLLFVSPPALTLAAAIEQQPVALALAGGAWLLQTLVFAPWVRHQRVPLIFALTLPAGSLLYAWMTCVSAWRHVRQRGQEWKGRTVSGTVETA